tara:strand:- start:35 stop:637 length:603 start_codon:yes stop_codon:yes gene_type:complete
MFIFYQNCHMLFIVTTQNLIIYKFILLYHIIEELDLDLNFKIHYVDSERILDDKIKSLNNYLIISNNKKLNFKNQITLSNLPINIYKLLEKINVEFLKVQFNSQSQVKINNYIIDLNSREMLLGSTKLKLTEKETNTIIYLSKISKPVSVDQLQENVWKYQSDIETHTVETHIYRLRKKILNMFNDNEFIISKKNGYQIK